jgi:hypothetical protein
VIKTCFVSIVYRSQVIFDLLESKNGDLSTSAARGRSRPEVTLPIDRATMVEY